MKPSLFFYEGDRVELRRPGPDRPKGNVLEVNDDEDFVRVKFDSPPVTLKFPANALRKVTIEGEVKT